MPIPFMAAASLGMQGLQSIMSLAQGIKQKRMADRIKPVRQDYQVSQFAKDQYTDAQNQQNARMAGAANLERNLYTNQANAMGQVNRNAGSGTQALAMAAGLQGQTNQGFENLQLNEAQDVARRQADLNQARAGMTNEYDKIYQDQLNKYQEQNAWKQQLLMSSMQNKANALSGATNMVAAGAAGFLGEDAANWSPQFGGGGGSLPRGFKPQVAQIQQRSTPIAFPNIGAPNKIFSPYGITPTRGSIKGDYTPQF